MFKHKSTHTRNMYIHITHMISLKKLVIDKCSPCVFKDILEYLKYSRMSIACLAYSRMLVAYFMIFRKKIKMRNLPLLTKRDKQFKKGDIQGL